MDELRWGNIPVGQGILITWISTEVRDAFKLATFDALKVVNETCANPFPVLEDGKFGLLVIQRWDALHVEVFECGLHDHLPKNSHELLERIARVRTDCHFGVDEVTVEMIVGILERIRLEVPLEWPRWLEWRLRRRYKPDWLKALKGSFKPIERKVVPLESPPS